MVYFYISVLGPLLLGILLSVIVWSIVAGTNFQSLSSLNVILLLINAVLLAFSVWVWLYFVGPNMVSVFWFALALHLILAVATLLLKNKKINSQAAPYSLILAFFFIDKLFILLLSVTLFMLLNLKVTTSRMDVRPISASVPKISGAAIGIIILLMTVIMVNQAIYLNVDRAEYFESNVTTADELPFSKKVDGSMLRVVDIDLAASIMKKSNKFGSNTIVTEIHLGNINGSTFWIGAVVFEGNKLLRQDLNHYQGFIAVDFRDPEKEPIIISQEFHIGTDLVLDKNLYKLIYGVNPNYEVGDNRYFTMATDGSMRLIVPYSIKGNVILQQNAPGAGIITQEQRLRGGILEITSSGDIKNYQDLSELPSYAKVQYYSESWLESLVSSWGISITSIDPRDFGTFAAFGGPFKSQWRMGIDDDVRVVIDPDTGTNIQYFLLESTGSSNQVVRGAMKANESGIFFYDWSEFGFIDSNAARSFAETEITNQLDTTTHGYDTLFPLLFPIRENPTSLDDYAYVVPLQFRDVRFGGVVIVDPADKAGSHISAKIVGNEDLTNISKVIDQAIDEYLAGISGEEVGDFTIEEKESYVEEGNTIYVMSGNFSTADANKTIEIVFRQDRIVDLDDWLKVVLSKAGDVLKLKIQLEGGIYFATDVVT